MCARRSSQARMNSIERPPLTVLFEDCHLIAVSKPAGIPVQADPTGDLSLVEQLRRQLNEPGLGLVHRLDRPVTGAILFARDPETLAHLNQIFRERTIEKIYWAIVQGQMFGTRTLEHRLEHDVRSRRARAIEPADADEGVARLTVRSLSVGDRYSLLELRPEGGAFHQIRAQLSAAGFHIKGDVKYGARRGERDRSIALHARSLTFSHPIQKVPIQIEAPAPQAPLWDALIARIGAAG